MSETRPEIIRRKSQMDDKPVRRKILDLLKASAIIEENFTGSLEIVFNQGGIVGSRKTLKDPL